MMALQLTRAVSMRFQRVGRQLREVSQSWLTTRLTGRRHSVRVRTEEAGDEMPAPAFHYLHKSGEMNHLGRYRCDACDGEMRLTPRTTPESPSYAAAYVWECSGCGAVDETSFRICRCGRQTVLEKHGASARELPVSLNAGGCTECERCAICDGVLAVGNVKWFYGRWTHLYPDTEFDRRTQQQYVVTRERSKFYGFHCHFSCAEKDPLGVERVLQTRTPDWYVQGIAKQKIDDDARLYREGRCRICRGRLDLWSRALDRDAHFACESPIPVSPTHLSSHRQSRTKSHKRRSTKP